MSGILSFFRFEHLAGRGVCAGPTAPHGTDGRAPTHARPTTAARGAAWTTLGSLKRGSLKLGSLKLGSLTLGSLTLGSLTLGWALLGLAGAFVGGCQPEDRRPLRPLRDPVDPPAQPSLQNVYAPETQAGGRDAGVARVTPAFLVDQEYAQSGTVHAKRVIYRVRLRVPRSLGEAEPIVPPPTAELIVDLTEDRLRARFEGSGWPVAAGSEVRLRSDESGVYLFDGAGGRPLNRGELATWFEGGALRHGPSFRVQTPPTRAQHGLGTILCQFIAEWSNQPLQSLARRCGSGGTTPSFRVGLWRAERTAEVDVELPRSALRADHVHPPVLESVDHRVFLGPSGLSALKPDRRLPDPLVQTRPEEVGTNGLIIRNRGRARAIITINGAPVGWMNVGSTLELQGLRPGIYSVGAMRPMGLQTSQQREIIVPAKLSMPW